MMQLRSILVSGVFVLLSALAGAAHADGPSPATELLRTGTNGKADADFGKGGVAGITMKPQLLSYDGAGGILVFGQAVVGADSKVLVTRLTSNGQPDAAFGKGAPLTLGPPGTTTARAVTVDNKGRVMLLASTKASGATGETVAVYRFGATGLDTAFGTAGVSLVTMPPTAGQPSATTIAFDPGSARILVGGTANANAASRTVFVAKLRGDGSYDSTFVGAHGNDVLEAVRVLVDDVSRIYLVTNRTGASYAGTTPGDYVPSATAVVVFRFAANGTPDSSYGTAGALAVEEAGRSVGAVDAFVMPGGPGAWHPTQLVLGGYTTSGQDVAQMKPTVMRFNDKGSMDSSFGTGGRIELADPSQNHLGRIRRVARDGSGRIVVAGAYRTGATSAGSKSVLFVSRLNANGQPDSAFGSGGVSTFITDSFEPEIDPQGRALFRAP